MEFKQFESAIVVRLQRGEEIVASLKQLCAQENIRLASVTGIGAAEHIELGYYDVTTQEYSSRKFDGQHEITALVGNVTTMNGETYLHLHITIGDNAFQAYAGHLASAVVSGTCEAVLHLIDGHVDRHKDEETGLNVLTL
jgi:uncharacterized protein